MSYYEILREAPTDYTQNTDGSDTDSEETPQSGAADESSPTDYTETDDTLTADEDTDADADPDADNTTDDGTGDDADAGATDYTDGADTGDDSSDTTDTDATADENTETEETPAQRQEKMNNRLLLEDLISLHNNVESVIGKLNASSKDNVLVNKIITQVSLNLSQLLKVIFEYTVYEFLKNKYVTNLYKYNLFVEAFKINVEMLKKIKVLVPNTKTNI